MESPMPLPASVAQLHQALRDFTDSHDAAMASDRIADKLALSSALTALSLVLRNAKLTPHERATAEGARRAIRTSMGMEE